VGQKACGQVWTAPLEVCGTVEVTFPAATGIPVQSVPVFFVIDDGGNEFRALETVPGIVVTRIGKRQFRVGD